jgi:S-adenosylmethionine-diacylgycerolhomoserine-N-methlytransferase
MDPSTLPSSSFEFVDASYGLDALRGFYRRQARIYDWTRPLLLLGRRRALAGLEVQARHDVLDVGCGTGFNLPHLAATGARVTGIEISPHMRARAERRLSQRGLLAKVRFDPRPYGPHDAYAEGVDRILFSYSLSMIPPYAEVLERARRDLRSGGRIAVVDFLDARPGVHSLLRRSHVYLGPERVRLLARLFPQHRLELRRTPLWRYYVFWGDVD